MRRDALLAPGWSFRTVELKDVPSNCWTWRQNRVDSANAVYWTHATLIEVPGQGIAALVAYNMKENGFEMRASEPSLDFGRAVSPRYRTLGLSQVLLRYI